MNKKIFVFIKCFLILIILFANIWVEGRGFSENKELNQEDNVFKLLVGDSPSESKFDLRNLISQNIVVRDQGNANNCWTFATIGALESSLALKRKKENMSVKIFDLSEAHVKYGSRYDMFLNGQKNDKGYDYDKNRGGNFSQALNYMTNGFGPVDERWLRYNEDEPRIELNSIKSITPSVTVMDTVDLSIEDVSDQNAVNTVITKIKSHIKNYGGVHFGLKYSSYDSYTNQSNKARYCDVKLNPGEAPNHAVVLIGWDDNYSASNFNKNPGKNGAWIFKNSYGNYSTVEYLSYYDKTGYTETFGFTGVEEGKNYNYQYQHQVLPPVIDFYVKKGPVINQLGVAEVYSRDINNSNEKITRLSVDVQTPGTYQFFVNPNNDDLTNLQEVSVNKTYLEKGFHTVKLNTPMQLTGSKFAIGMKVPIDSEGEFHMLYEPQNNIPGYTASVSKNGETFVNYIDSTNSSNWMDFVARGKGNSSLKAYTNIANVSPYPTKIKILSEPNKLEYVKGVENLDITGGKLLVSMSNGMTNIVDFSDSNVKITGFDNSSLGTKNIKVKYFNNEASFTVNIIDAPNELISLKLKKTPTKIEYFVNETLSRDGGILEARYNNGRMTEINTNNSSVKFSSPNMSVPGTKQVTITYEGKSVNYNILVKEKPITLSKIEILNLPDKINYVQNLEQLDLTGGKIRATFSNNSTLDIAMNSNDVNVTGFNNSNIGKNRLTVEYKGKTTNFDINIIEKPKVNIVDAVISNKPNKLKYKKGEFLDLSGGTVIISYSDGSSRVVDMSNSEMIQYSNYNPNILGRQNIILSIRDFSKTLNFDIEVVNNDPIIDQNKVLENQIISNQIIQNQIIENQILNNQILSNQIITNQIENNKILQNQIISNQIENNKIVQNQIIANQIENNKIIQNQIVTNQIENNKILQNQIIANQIENNKIIQNQIVSNQINQNTIDNNKIIENQIIQNSIITNQIIQNQITQNQILNNQIIQNQIEQNKISENLINNNKVNDENIVNENTVKNEVSNEISDDTNSNIFNEARAEIINSSKYVFTDKNKNYIEVEINISNLKINNLNNTNIEYYLSGNSGDVISDNKYSAVDKIYKRSDGSYYVKFKVNSKNLNNLTDIINSDRLYVYLKSNNGNKIVLPLKNISKTKNYINNNLVDVINDENWKKYGDNTTNKGLLPQTGALPFFAVTISIITILGVVSYFRFKNINK